MENGTKLEARCLVTPGLSISPVFSIFATCGMKKRPAGTKADPPLPFRSNNLHHFGSSQKMAPVVEARKMKSRGRKNATSRIPPGRNLGGNPGAFLTVYIEIIHKWGVYKVAFYLNQMTYSWHEGAPISKFRPCI